MTYTLEEVIEFIAEWEPNFKCSDSRNKFGMFTVGTQHIYADSIEELLEYGVNRYKKHGNKSDFRLLIESVEDAL